MIRNFLLFSFCILLFACTPSEKEKDNVERIQLENPPQEAFNVVYYYSDSGKVVARLKAPYVIEIPKEDAVYSEFPEGFLLEFLNSRQEVKSTMSAESGLMNMESGIAEATGNVVVVNEENERLETEHLNWDKGNDKIQTNHFVKIHTKDEIIYGDSLLANTDFTDYRIYQIRGIINMKE